MSVNAVASTIYDAKFQGYPYICALMVSLGTTEKKLAHRSGSQLNAFLDLMLDELADANLSDEALRDFLQVEIRTYLRSLVSRRRREHMDKSLNIAKARSVDGDRA